MHKVHFFRNGDRIGWAFVPLDCDLVVYKGDYFVRGTDQRTFYYTPSFHKLNELETGSINEGATVP